MGDLAKILYQQFFLRDVLGKVAPGSVVIFALQRLFEINLLALIPTGKVEGPWLLVLYVVAIPVCYIVDSGCRLAAKWLESTAQPLIRSESCGIAAHP